MRATAAAVRASIERDTEIGHANRNLRLMRADEDSAWLDRLLSDLEEASGILSRSEKECLRYMAQGLTCEQTGTALYLSVETVKTHLTMARRKLRAKNTTHACCIALRQGLIA